jgi:hypothetical protein
MQQVIYIIIQLTLFLIASYFIFYKKYLEELGKQTAELTLLKQKTLEIETVKSAFNEQLETFKKQMQLDIAKEVEPIRATLNRENIAFQIYNTEYIKLRFQRLDDLYGKLYELKKYCQYNLFLYTDEQDFRNKKDKFHEHYRNAEDSLYRAAIYIDDTVTVSVIDLLNETFKAQQAFTMFYNTDPTRHSFIFNSQRQDLMQSMTERNNNSLDRLNNSIDNLPTLLRNIETEFKRHLTLPNI